MEKPKFEQALDKRLENLIEESNVLVNPESGLAMVVIKPDAFKNRKHIKLSKYKNTHRLVQHRQ